MSPNVSLQFAVGFAENSASLMKRTRVKRLLIGLSLLLAGASAASGDVPASVEMRLQTLTPDVYYVQGKARVATDNQGFVSNAGFIVTEDGVIVFDALGTPALARKLLDLIRGITDQPIKRVYVSHDHADHVYGLQVFKQAGAVIYAARGARDYLDAEIATDEAAFARFFHAMLAEGVAMAPGAYEAIFVGAAHTDDVIEQIADRAHRAASVAVG